MTIFVCNLVLDPSLPSSRSTSSAILILLPQIAAVEDHRDLDVQLDEDGQSATVEFHASVFYMDGDRKVEDPFPLKCIWNLESVDREWKIVAVQTKR